MHRARAGSAASACRTRSARRTASRRRSAAFASRQQRVVAARRSACAPRGRRGRAPARRCGRACVRAVSRSASPQAAPRAATRLACERRITPSSITFSAVGGERRAGGGDVDDQLGGAGGRRAFGRARAFDDAVVDDAVLREEVARQVHVFGGDPHLAVVLQRGTRSRRRRDRPCCARRSRPAAPRPPHWRSRSRARRSAPRAASASGIISRIRSSPVTPKCTAPCASCAGDLGGREIGDLDAGQAGDRAAIVARAARLDQLRARRGRRTPRRSPAAGPWRAPR